MKRRAPRPKRESDRLLGAFGKREMELAAVVIIDKGLLRKDIHTDDFPDDGSVPVSMYVSGFNWLVAMGYLVRVGFDRFRVTDEFLSAVRHEL